MLGHKKHEVPDKREKTKWWMVLYCVICPLNYIRLASSILCWLHQQTRVEGTHCGHHNCYHRMWRKIGYIFLYALIINAWTFLCTLYRLYKVLYIVYKVSTKYSLNNKESISEVRYIKMQFKIYKIILYRYKYNYSKNWILQGIDEYIKIWQKLLMILFEYMEQ